MQAAPAFLDLAAGVAKAQKLIEQAAEAGARLIAFPELWLPGYPWWIWLGPPAFGMQFMPRYVENALRRDSDEMRALCETARRHKIHVVLGYAERAGGTLYIAQSMIGDDGSVLAHRRKLKPARTERSVFGQGDGSDLAVVDTPLGRLGALSCGEHFQPLLKSAMYAQFEQVHVAAWPAFSLLRGRAFLNGPGRSDDGEPDLCASKDNALCSARPRSTTASRSISSARLTSIAELLTVEGLRRRRRAIEYFRTRWRAAWRISAGRRGGLVSPKSISRRCT